MTIEGQGRRGNWISIGEVKTEIEVERTGEKRGKKMRNNSHLSPNRQACEGEMKREEK